MNRRLQIPVNKPQWHDEPLPLYLGVPTGLRLQLVGEDFPLAPGRSQLPGLRNAASLTAALAAHARTTLLADDSGHDDRSGDYLVDSPDDHLTQ
jgi:hypothetical protein